MQDLFASDHPEPLAETLRPRTLAEVVGQQHLLAPGQPLELAIRSGRLPSMILWGPPGVGKTTLARLLAQLTDYAFIPLSAVFSGVRDIRAAVAQAEQFRANGRATLLFIDEIHRFNKAQQDALLPYVESGLFVFIGATTENPSFEVNAALLSRAQVLVLKPLTEVDLQRLLERALTQAGQGIRLTPEATAYLVSCADGDARRLLNHLDVVLQSARTEGITDVDQARLEVWISRAAPRFDKGGDVFYDQISALHKSVRGSAPDAALYWFARMLQGGADPRYLARRILRMAWEDIGLADPRALTIARDAADTYERLGSPEGELALGQAVLYLAVAPKSNAGYKAFNAAMALVREEGSREVPLHLRNAPTRLMKDLGHGASYRYAHDETDGFAAGERYLPDGMPEPGWYQPVPRGLEIKIGERLEALRQRNRAAAKVRPPGKPEPGSGGPG